MNILWVKSGPLFPLNTGGRRRTHAMLQELAKEHQVTYLAMLPEGQKLEEGEDEAPYAQRKIWIPNLEPAKKSPQFFVALLKNFLFSTSPYILDRYRNADFSKKLVELDASGEFEVILCDFLTPAINFDFDRLRTKKILFQHNVEAQIWKRLAEEQRNPITKLYFRDQYHRMHESERLLSEPFDGVITVSEEDAEQCREEYGLSNVLGAVPTGVDTEFFKPPEPRQPEPGLIGFLGSMDWMPNIECVEYFANDIFSLIQDKHPNARFRIIGRDPAPSVRGLAEGNDAIEVTGTVDDVRPHLDACEVLVVPLRSGGGTRIKIFEAMAQGVPVVSTTIGAEGLPVKDGETILIADDSFVLARAVSRILQSQDLGNHLSSEARNKLVEHHNWKIVTEKFIDILQ